MNNRLSQAWHSILHLLWPHTCSACDQRLLWKEAGFCADCATTLTPLDPYRSCPRCGAPFVAETEEQQSPRICTDCTRLQTPLFSRVTALYHYGGALVHALQRLKWQQRDDIALSLGALLAPGLHTASAQCDVLVPVPLHRSRHIQRGYNQSALLAKWARRAAASSLPLAYHALTRIQSTAPQSAQSSTSRVDNVRGAFVVSTKSLIQNKRVLLLDDIVTTGATAQACSIALLDAGATSVEVLALCRTAGW